jgi:hypothetical protein
MSHHDWASAIMREVQSVLENGTWIVVDNILQGKVPINAMWLFKAKIGPNGMVDKIKARIVAKVNEKSAGIDFLETFTLIIK